MNEPTWLRRLAEALLSAALAIAPGDTLEWGQAMLGELRHVEGNWSAFFWSLGSAGVLAKHALVAFIFGAKRPTVPSGGDLFAKESPMRKPALVITASCVLASLLFFLAPVFRQAFRVSLTQWHDVFHIRAPLDEPPPSDSTLEAIAQAAKENYDAEALAFVAMHTRNQAESVRFAESAVHLDPKLTWVYGIVAVQWSTFPELDRWVPALEKYDPQNALPYLIVAEKLDIDEVLAKKFPRHVQDESAAWKDAMSAAFSSPKLDTYHSRFADLEPRVLSRYRVDDPFQAIDDGPWYYGLPTYAAQDEGRYGKLLLDRGEALEAGGDRKGAFEEYSRVAKFAQLMGAERYFFPNQPLHNALTHLENLSRKNGAEAQAELYASLANQTEKEQQEALARLRAGASGGLLSRWDASVARGAGAAMLFSAIVLATCLVAVAIRARSIRVVAFRPSPLTLAIACCSAVVALLSSAMLYVSYRPYSEIFQRFVRYGDEAGLQQLRGFLAYTQVPLGTGANRFLNFQGVVYCFWLGVAALCALTIVLGVLRYLQTRRRATAV